ncbi:hypothetical protein V6N13_046528 [Hibiscus sabdariffa]
MSLKLCLRSECERVLLPEFLFEVSYGFIIDSGTAAAMDRHPLLLVEFTHWRNETTLVISARSALQQQRYALSSSEVDPFGRKLKSDSTQAQLI